MRSLLRGLLAQSPARPENPAQRVVLLHAGKMVKKRLPLLLFHGGGPSAEHPEENRMQFVAVDLFILIPQREFLTAPQPGQPPERRERNRPLRIQFAGKAVQHRQHLLPLLLRQRPQNAPAVNPQVIHLLQNPEPLCQRILKRAAPLLRLQPAESDQMFTALQLALKEDGMVERTLQRLGYQRTLCGADFAELLFEHAALRIPGPDPALFGVKRGEVFPQRPRSGIPYRLFQLRNLRENHSGLGILRLLFPIALVSPPLAEVVEGAPQLHRFKRPVQRRRAQQIRHDVSGPLLFIFRQSGQKRAVDLQKELRAHLLRQQSGTAQDPRQFILMLPAAAVRNPLRPFQPAFRTAGLPFAGNNLLGRGRQPRGKNAASPVEQIHLRIVVIVDNRPPHRIDPEIQSENPLFHFLPLFFCDST